MKNYELNHDFGYGTSINNDDSNIKKLKLNKSYSDQKKKKKINDLQIYLQDLIESQMINTTIKNNVIRKTGFKDVKLIIKTI